MWRLKQKEGTYTKDLVAKFTKRQDLVTSFCADTCPTAKACMLFEQYKKVADCDLDSELLMTAEPDLLLSLALQVLNQNSDITEDKAMKAAA